MEDAATLGALLRNAKTYTDIPHLLAAYMDIRKPRCRYIQEVSRKNGKIFHLEDGPQQVERDSILSRVAEVGDSSEKQFGYNVDEEVQCWMRCEL
jgi:salicylate hydroxylase